MLKSYCRRAFLLLALTALEPAVASAARGDDGPSLWDVLSRTETPNAAISGMHNPAAGQKAVLVRRPLGPIPGITLGGTEMTAGRKHSGFLGEVGDWFDNLERMTNSKVKATGSGTVSLQTQNVSGSDAAYQSDQYYGRGGNGVYTDEDLTIDATLFKWFHYQTRVSNSLFKNPNDNRVKMDYNGSKTRVEYGDLNVSFAGNSLLDFNRYLHGMEITDKWTPHFTTTVLYAETKATTQTIVINGNNSSGPYYVYAGQIVDGSAQVRVDNSVLTSGTDYTLDSYTGQLNFLHNRIILQSSTIAVSFESLGIGSTQGTISGFRGEMASKRGLSFGVTYVAQTAQGTGANGLRTEDTQGYGSPAPYSTQYPIDLSKPIIVTVGGAQLPSNAYSFNGQTLYTDQIFISVAVPQNTTIQFQYYPYNSAPTPGNRSIVGLDTHYAMGRLGTLTFESAFSGLSISNTNIDGHAFLARADLNPFKNFHTTLTLKDVNPTFSSIQSPGFTQNEKSVELAADYSPLPKLKLNFDIERASRPSYSGTTQFTVNTDGNDSFRQYSLGANYSLSKSSTLSFTRSDITTIYAVGGNSTTSNDALSYSQTIKSVGIDFSVNDNASNVSSSSALLGVTSTTPGALYTSTSSSYGGRLGLHWQAAKALNFTGSASINKITTESDGTTSGSTATDSQISTTFTGIRKIRLTYSLDLSDTGSVAINSVGSGSVVTPVATSTTTNNRTNLVGAAMGSALASMERDLTSGGSTTGTTTTTTTTAGALFGGGINSNLGGFGNQNNVVNSALGFSSFGGKSLTNRVQMDIAPRKNMQVALNLSKSSSLGDYQYNNDNTSMGLNMNWQVSDRMQLTGAFNMQHLVYSGSFGGSDNHTALFSFQGRPFGGKLGLQLGFQSMQTSSAFSSTSSATGTTPTTPTTGTTSSLTNTSNDLGTLTARLDYPISSRQTLFVELLNSTTSGYLANVENDIRFGLDYSLTKTLKFSFGWQILRHTYDDAANASQNYKASNLLAQFGVHF